MQERVPRRVKLPAIVITCILVAVGIAVALSWRTGLLTSHITTEVSQTQAISGLTLDMLESQREAYLREEGESKRGQYFRSYALAVDQYLLGGDISQGVRTRTADDRLLSPEDVVHMLGTPDLMHPGARGYGPSYVYFYDEDRTKDWFVHVGKMEDGTTRVGINARSACDFGPPWKPYKGDKPE